MIAGKLPVSVRYEDEDILAFDDINPHAPVHVLVIPKKHIAQLSDITKRDEKLMGQMVYRCKALAKELGIEQNGYRVTINVGGWGGQIVPHLHFHLIGGAPLTERLGLYTEAIVAVSER